MSVRENVKTSKLFKLLTIADYSDLLLILSFTMLTALAAQITIPVRPVPFTFQTTTVILSGAFLGAKKGAYSQFLYLMLGCLGLPVFAQIPELSRIGWALERPSSFLLQRELLRLLCHLQV